ncbi:MAG: hypothetical protein A2516_02425 [Alphaproteobacteria bacterium RIFOXYD12_FULL_60_8]|nr:MAG: hypothetical protein A2516_02425 [Alphaproteobacteria bacterium RIFOXYD12_FULL_60_8]
MKKLLILGGGLVVVIAVGLFVVASNIDSLIRAAIEKVGTEVTQVNVSLDGVKTSLSDKTAALNTLTVGNPSGFKTSEAMSLGVVSVSLGDLPGEGQPIVIKEVLISQPAITYEKGESGSNIDAIQRNVEQFAAKNSGGETASAEAEAGGEQKVIIENLYIKDGKINVSVLGMDPTPVALPNIHLKDIGKSNGGATPAEVAQKILGAITASASSVGGKLAENLAAGVGKGVDAAKGAAEGAMTGAMDSVGGAAGGMGGAMQGMFGK